MVVLEQPAQSLAAGDRGVIVGARRGAVDQVILEPRVRSLDVIVGDELTACSPELRLAEQDPSTQTLRLDREPKPFGMRIQTNQVAPAAQTVRSK